MPYPIGKLPRGLTALLSLRSSGDTPQVLADSAVLTLDATPLYLLDSREATGFFTNAAPATGFNFFTTAMTVPPGELWYVWHYILVLQTGVGVTIDAAPAINLDGVGAGAVIGDYQVVAASQSVRAFNSLPFWAGPGSGFGFNVRSLTGAPTVQGNAVITRLRI